MTLNVTPPPPAPIVPIRVFALPVVREVPLPPTPAGSAW